MGSDVRGGSAAAGSDARQAQYSRDSLHSGRGTTGEYGRPDRDPRVPDALVPDSRVPDSRVSEWQYGSDGRYDRDGRAYDRDGRGVGAGEPDRRRSDSLGPPRASKPSDARDWEHDRPSQAPGASAPDGRHDGVRHDGVRYDGAGQARAGDRESGGYLERLQVCRHTHSLAHSITRSITRPMNQSII